MEDTDIYSPCLIASKKTYSVGIGKGVLALQTTSSADNTCIGYQSGDSITSNNYNTTIGYDADVANTSYRGTAIGHGTYVNVNSLTTLSTAIGLGAVASGNSIFAIGCETRPATIVDFGKRFNSYYNDTVWEGSGTFTGADITATALETLDGLITFYNTGSAGSAAHILNIPAAANIAAIMPGYGTNTGFTLKVGVYNSTSTSVSVTVNFGTGWTVYGNAVIPNGTYANGSKTFYCYIDVVSPLSMVAYAIG